MNLHSCDECRRTKTACSGEKVLNEGCNRCRNRGKSCQWTDGEGKITKANPAPQPCSSGTRATPMAAADVAPPTHGASPVTGAPNHASPPTPALGKRQCPSNAVAGSPATLPTLSSPPAPAPRKRQRTSNAPPATPAAPIMTPTASSPFTPVSCPPASITRKRKRASNALASSPLVRTPQVYASMHKTPGSLRGAPTFPPVPSWVRFLTVLDVSSDLQLQGLPPLLGKPPVWNTLQELTLTVDVDVAAGVNVVVDSDSDSDSDANSDVLLNSSSEVEGDERSASDASSQDLVQRIDVDPTAAYPSPTPTPPRSDLGSD